MATIPAGSVIILNYATYEGALSDRIGTRLAIDPTTGELLAACPTRAFAQKENAYPVVMSLDDGRFVNCWGNVTNVYHNNGARQAVVDYDTIHPPDTVGDTGVVVAGSDATTKYWWAGYYIDPLDAPFTQYLVGGVLHADTAVASATVAVDNAISDNFGNIAALFHLCASTTGVLYYILGDDPDPAVSVLTLKAYDLVGDTALSDVTTYAPGTPYPIAGFAMLDGTLLLNFSDDSVRHVNQTTGADIFVYTQTGVDIFAGATDAAFWTHATSPQTLTQVRVSDGVTVSAPTLESGYVLLDRATPYIARTDFDACTPAPGPGTTRMIRRLRRFTLPSSEDNNAIFMPEIEILLQPGVGHGQPTDQGYDPQLMLRVSKDGGVTYGAEQTAAVGKQGEFANRVRFRRTPNRYRNAVVELVATDPVEWTLIDALGKRTTDGTS